MDATTNPSLLYKAATLKEYQHLVDGAIAFGKSKTDVSENERLSLILDKLAVSFGKEITEIVPGLDLLERTYFYLPFIIQSLCNITPHNDIT